MFFCVSLAGKEKRKRKIAKREEVERKVEPPSNRFFSMPEIVKCLPPKRLELQFRSPARTSMTLTLCLVIPAASTGGCCCLGG